MSLAKVSLVFRHGRGEMSKHALKARRCCVVRMVLGRLGPRLLFFVHNSSQRYSSGKVFGSYRGRNQTTNNIILEGRDFTIIKTLQHLHFLLVVGAAEELTGLHNELVALLQLAAAHHTNETPQMEDVVGCAVHELIWMDLFAARKAFVFRKYSEF